jgi:hydrogenase expression/formation protein HypC
MCLAIPAKVLKIQDDDMATVDVSGVQKEISLTFVDGVSEGDYVIMHMGYALNKLDEKEAIKTLETISEASRLADQMKL